MSIQATRVKDSQDIGLGIAEIFVGDSETYISSTGIVLPESAYLGAMFDVSFKSDRSFIPVSDVIGDVVVLLDRILVKAGLTITATLLELSKVNLALAGGGSGASANILNDFFAQPGAKRVEFKFTYPNGTDTMHIILPKAKIITQSVGGGFKATDPFSSPITIVAMKSLHASWVDDPMGKLDFS